MSRIDPALTARFDEMLMQITQQAGDGVHGLLDTVFSFLQRRTDFFYEAEPGDKMGFPPKFAESLVYQFYKKYEDEHQKKFPSKGDALIKRWDAFKKKEIELKEKKAQEKNEPKTEEIKDELPASQTNTKVKEVLKHDVESKPVSIPAPKQQVPQPKEGRPFSEISSYNGGKTDKYIWSQSINNVDMQIPLPKGTTARQLLVVIKSKHLKVQFKNSSEVIVDGELSNKVKVEESFWSVEDNQSLMLNFEKAGECIWKQVLLGDEEIDTTKVDNSKKLEEFDWETQGHLRKVLYEQERKRQGLPTTEEAKQAELMEEVMKKQGMANPQNQLPYDASLYKRTDGTNAPVSPFAAPM